MIFHVMWIPVTYGLPSSSKEITLTMPLPIIVLSLLLLWTFLCFRKILINTNAGTQTP